MNKDQKILINKKKPKNISEYDENDFSITTRIYRNGMNLISNKEF